MSSNNSEKNNRNEKQKSTQVEENPATKNMDGIGDAPTGEATRVSKLSDTMIEITEYGDNDNTLYLTCTEFNANKSIEPAGDVTLAESTLDSSIIESNSGGSVTNSSLDETLAEEAFDITIGDLTMNSTFGEQEKSLKQSEKLIDQPEIITIKELLDEGNNILEESVGNESDKSIKIDNATVYISFDSNSSYISIPPASPEVNKLEDPPDSKKPRNMFTEYRENISCDMSESASSFQLEDSRLEESWLYDRVVDTNDQGDVEEIEILMSNLEVTKRKELRDEKDMSQENVNKILENVGDEFGPDVDTTNLLVMVRKSLAAYLEIEEIYDEHEKRARIIAERRFHLTLEEFLETIDNGIEKKEGLDRYTRFLEEVDRAGLERERYENIKKNLMKFATYPCLKNEHRPFRYEHEKEAYFSKSMLTAFYMHDANPNRFLSHRRGYSSV